MDFSHFNKEYKVNTYAHKNTKIRVVFYFSAPIFRISEDMEIDTTYEFLIFKMDGKTYCNHLIYNDNHYDFWENYECNSNIWTALKNGKITDNRVLDSSGYGYTPLTLFTEKQKEIAMNFVKKTVSKKHLDYFIEYCP